MGSKISSSNAQTLIPGETLTLCVCVCISKSLSCVQLFSTPWTVAGQGPLYKILPARILEDLPSPVPGGLPDPGIEPRFPDLLADSLLTEPPGKPRLTGSA